MSIKTIHPFLLRLDPIPSGAKDIGLGARRELLFYSNKKCFYCKRELVLYSKTQEHTWQKYAVDHFIPFSKGGRTEWGNLVPSCFSCNSKKNDIHPRKFCPSKWRKFLAMKKLKPIEVSSAKVFMDRIQVECGITPYKLVKLLERAKSKSLRFK